MTSGTATRVYAEIQEDGTLKAIRIPDNLRALLGASVGSAEKNEAG